MLVPGTLWKQYHIEVGKLMTSELGLGLLDKADVQNENPDKPTKNISCTEHRTTWD
jgi:Xaa-Pro aminopeptidase